jgi:hypothetical protein
MLMDFYQMTHHYIPQDSTFKDLFCMFPARYSSVIPKKLPYCLPTETQMQIKEEYVISQALKG